YAWNRISPRLHLLSGVVVAVAGALSAVFVITANAWMNHPIGFDIDENGNFINVDPVAAVFNPHAVHEIAHMLVAAYLATGILVAAIHAFIPLRHPESTLHRKAFGLAMSMV